MEFISQIQKPIKVALIDDDPLQLEIIKIFLEPEQDIKLSTFSSPSDAYQEILHDEYDCVVTDYRMQDLNGVEFVKIIRATSNVPIIMYTMYDERKIIDQALYTDANILIIKDSDFASARNNSTR